MPIFYDYCPHCDALKAVDVQLHTEWQGDPIMGRPVTYGDVDRVPEDDECRCVLTPEEEQDVKSREDPGNDALDHAEFCVPGSEGRYRIAAQ